MTSPFTPQIVAWAQAMEAKWQIPAALGLAQAYVESGLGAHTPPNSNNWFGIKAVGGGGSVTATREQNPDGSWVTIQAGFAVYDSPADGFDAYGRLLGLGTPYRAAVTAYLASSKEPSDVRALARAIAVKYATAQSYGATLVNTMETFNLYQYDNAPPATQGTPPMATAAPAPATPAIVPTSTPIVNAAANQNSLNIGDALEIIVKAGAAILPAALQAGESMLPPPISTIIKIFGPSVFQGYITSAATSLETLVAGKTIAIPSTGNGIIDSLVGMVVSQLNANEFAWVSGFAGLEATLQAQVTSWLNTPHAAAVAPTLATAAAAPVAKAS